MAFALTPADAPTVQGLPGNWLQFRKDGANRGNANVAVLDIVGDPAVLRATRGVGENSHVVTIERIVAEAPVIGWLEAIDSSGGTAAHANNGTGWLNLNGDNPPPVVNRDLWAGIVGYTTGTILWSVSWTPVGSDPAPTLVDATVNPVNVNWPRKPPGSDAWSGVIGELILTCTVDGTPVSVGERLVMTSSDDGFDSYAQVAWGPEP